MNSATELTASGNYAVRTLDAPATPKKMKTAAETSAMARDSRGGGYSSRLAQIDIAGFNERQLVTPTDASDPSWSPLLS